MDDKLSKICSLIISKEDLCNILKSFFELPDDVEVINIVMNSDRGGRDNIFFNLISEEFTGLRGLDGIPLIQPPKNNS